jgi:hypothetical protein
MLSKIVLPLRWFFVPVAIFILCQWHMVICQNFLLFCFAELNISILLSVYSCSFLWWPKENEYLSILDFNKCLAVGKQELLISFVSSILSSWLTGQWCLFKLFAKRLPRIFHFGERVLLKFEVIWLRKECITTRNFVRILQLFPTHLIIKLANIPSSQHINTVAKY